MTINDILQSNPLVLATDSYKLTHWMQYPEGTEKVYSYFEARKGAQYGVTTFFGLQSIINFMFQDDGFISAKDIDAAEEFVTAHLGNPALFNRKGWEHVLNLGYWPLKIKAVPEGLGIPVDNVLMTVENTTPESYWLTNHFETLLTHVWYPSTVATVSRQIKEKLAFFLDITAESKDGLPFMLHDFGFRGATGFFGAMTGGMAHLVNFKGTDTIPGMMLAMADYDAKLEDLAFSVPATEHSVMTSLGENGEGEIVQNLLNSYPSGILSVVADSYNIYDFVRNLGEFKDQIEGRDGVFVVRPDSVTKLDTTPADMTAWIIQELWNIFGGTKNSKGFKVLNPKVRVLWGDGIGPEGINSILDTLVVKGFSAENMVFGMGGGLLQKVNRDTQRFAFKCSAQYRDDEWIPIQKKPLDMSKASKAGRLKLVLEDGKYRTVPEDAPGDDIMVTVFENGDTSNHIDFATVRENSEK